MKSKQGIEELVAGVPVITWKPKKLSNFALSSNSQRFYDSISNLNHEIHEMSSPGDHVRILLAHPSGQHASIRAAEGDNRTRSGTFDAGLEISNQFRVICQSLLGGEVSKVAWILEQVKA